MKYGLLVTLLLIASLAHADALSALGYASTIAGLLALGLAILVVIGMAMVLMRRPQWSGLHYLLGMLLLLSGDAYFSAAHPAPERLTVLLLMVLFNGINWVRAFLPVAVRRVGMLAIGIGTVGLASLLLAK